MILHELDSLQYVIVRFFGMVIQPTLPYYSTCGIDICSPSAKSYHTHLSIVLPNNCDPMCRVDSLTLCYRKRRIPYSRRRSDIIQHIKFCGEQKYFTCTHDDRYTFDE